jgi:RimJ/RimL family protein N-acetyltransferase
MQNPFILGEHLYLRPFERTDAPLLALWINDREITRNLKIHRPMSIQNEEDFIERSRHAESDVILGIALKESNKLIGSAGLHDIDNTNRHCMFGIMIGEKLNWGKGYGTDVTRLMARHAFETLNLNRVWLHVYEFNARGLRAYEKVGYKKEGVLRQHTYRDGRYWDVIAMSILRQEWDEQKKKVPAF